MNTNDTQPPSDSTEASKAAGGDCPSTPCSRLFRVQVTFDTVIYAEDEKEAKRKVKYGTGEIDDMPVSVLAMPIESKDGLPPGWNTACLPWGDAPPNTTIAEILSANAESIHGGAGAGKPRDASTPLDGESC